MRRCRCLRDFKLPEHEPAVSVKEPGSRKNKTVDRAGQKYTTLLTTLMEVRPWPEEAQRIIGMPKEATAVTAGKCNSTVQYSAATSWSGNTVGIRVYSICRGVWKSADRPLSRTDCNMAE